MLDMNPDGLGGIETVTTYLLATAVICLGLVVATGLVFFAMGRNGGLSRSQERGFRMVGIGVLAASVVAGLGGAISWATEQGTEDLMPESAKQQDLVIERNAPTTTCTEEAVRNFDEEDDELSMEERDELLDELLGRQVGEWDRGDDSQGISTVKWYAQGPDCSGDNLTVAEGTEVEIEYRTRESAQVGDETWEGEYRDGRITECGVEGTCEDN